MNMRSPQQRQDYFLDFLHRSREAPEEEFRPMLAGFFAVLAIRAEESPSLYAAVLKCFDSFPEAVEISRQLRRGAGQ
jgi:hypothetical protein